MSDWTCGRCGTRVLSGLSHACHYSTGGNINYSEQVVSDTRDRLIEVVAKALGDHYGWDLGESLTADAVAEMDVKAAEAVVDALRADGYRVVRLLPFDMSPPGAEPAWVTEELT